MKKQLTKSYEVSDLELVELIATECMGWTRTKCYGGDVWSPTPTLCTAWNPLTKSEHSKQVRDKLAENWDTNLDRSGNKSAFSLWPKGSWQGSEVPPAHIVIAENEFRAVALCCLKTGVA